MQGFAKEKNHTKINELISVMKGRELPVVQEETSMSDLVNAIIRFQHSRLLYVVNNKGQLQGNIVLDTLVRHVFSRSYEPQVHSRFLTHVITAKTAKDIMQRKTICATPDEEVGTVLDRMVNSDVNEIAIVDEDRRPVADLTMIDLLQFLLDRFQG